MVKVNGLAPVANERSKILILGTMPGAKSLKLKEYYANPNNQLWAIAGEIFGISRAAPYEEKVERLLGKGVALWDVLASCERVGSADKEIRTPRANDLVKFLRRHPSIRRVFFNGNSAKKMAEEMLPKLFMAQSYGFTVLPSTSPANTHISLRAKSKKWKRSITAGIPCKRIRRMEG